MRKQIQANCFIPTHVLDAALNGDEAICKMMLEKNAGYLLYRGTASDFSGRTYTDLTPFQAALVAGDDAMAKMMEPYFARLPNGEAIMQGQFLEIFPDVIPYANGVEAIEAAQKQKSETDFAPMLEEVIAAIKGASSADLQAAPSLKDNGSKLCKALDTFRGAFAKLSQEKIFNPHYLLAAFEAYANKFDWNNPDWNKLDLFCCQVIGFVQRFLPANYAQVFAYGLYDIVDNKHRCPRSFNFRYDPGFSFYPLTDSFTGLGFYCAVTDGPCTDFGVRSAGRRSRPLRGSAFKTYVEQKQQAFRTLITQRVQSDSQLSNPMKSLRFA